MINKYDPRSKDDPVQTSWKQLNEFIVEATEDLQQGAYENAAELINILPRMLPPFQKTALDEIVFFEKNLNNLAGLIQNNQQEIKQNLKSMAQGKLAKDKYIERRNPFPK